MAFDGIVAKQIAGELQNHLIGGKINKIFEPNTNEILLGIYSHGKNYMLDTCIASGNYRIHLTTNNKPNPIQAPNFCMLLRKHILGYKIEEIRMQGLERILFISLVGYNELNDITRKTLVIELMGKHSNIILLNENHRIIDSLRHLDILSGSQRDIMPARDYRLPNSEKIEFLDTSFSSFCEIMKDSIPSQAIPAYFTGISKTSITSLLSFLHLSDTILGVEELEKLYQCIQNLIKNLGTLQVSCQKIENDYSILPIPTDEELQANFVLDDFYTEKEAREKFTNHRNHLLKLVLGVLKKTQKKLDTITDKMKECNEMELYRIYGELLTSNLYRISNNENISHIILENYYDNNLPIDIPLDKSISPSSNAKKYFKKYHKLKNTLAYIQLQKKQVEMELDYLESVTYEIESAEDFDTLQDIENEIKETILLKDPTQETSIVKKNKVNKKKVHETYEPLTYQIDGFTFYVGKNNRQNDYISTKLGKNEDLWFHTQDIRSSHGLLKCNGSSVEEKTIIACAKIIATHSKAKLSSHVPVDYCFAKHVKKPSGSKPGMVIYTNQKTIYVN